MTITSERPDTEIDIIPDENEMSGINVQTFVDQQVGLLLEFFFFFKVFFGGHMSFFGATGTPVLDFW